MFAAFGGARKLRLQLELLFLWGEYTERNGGGTLSVLTYVRKQNSSLQFDTVELQNIRYNDTLWLGYGLIQAEFILCELQGSEFEGNYVKSY